MAITTKPPPPISQEQEAANAAAARAAARPHPPPPRAVEWQIVRPGHLGAGGNGKSPPSLLPPVGGHWEYHTDIGHHFQQQHRHHKGDGFGGEGWVAVPKGVEGGINILKNPIGALKQAANSTGEALTHIDPTTVEGRKNWIEFWTDTVLTAGIGAGVKAVQATAGKNTILGKAAHGIAGAEGQGAEAVAKHPIETLEVIGGAALVATGVGAAAGVGLFAKAGTQLAQEEVAYGQHQKDKATAGKVKAAAEDLKAQLDRAQASAAQTTGADPHPSFWHWLASLFGLGGGG